MCYATQKLIHLFVKCCNQGLGVKGSLYIFARMEVFLFMEKKHIMRGLEANL